MKRATGILALLWAQHGLGQTCSEPSLSEFSRETLVSGLHHPVDMVVHSDGRVFFVNQWTGYVGLFTPGQGESQIGSVPTEAIREDGALGITLDPDFDNSGWVYIFHSSDPAGSHILARYTYNNGSIGSRKEILRFDRTLVNSGPTAEDDQGHTGGGLAFDHRTGHLHLTTGDDSNPHQGQYGSRGKDNHEPIWDAQRTSANTNDLRGKSLRIVPIRFSDSESPSPGVGSTYEIPSGNLKETYADLWSAQEQNLVRPEIYTMGLRNPYRIKVDPLNGRVFIADVGANAEVNDPDLGPRGYDEINLAEGPGNYGWPYANGNNLAYIGQSYDGWSVGSEFDLENLQNLSPNNTGVTNLPPAVGALGYYNAAGTQTAPLDEWGDGPESVTLAGPYMYDPELSSDVKFPPYFHRKVFAGDWMRRSIFWMELDYSGALMDAREFLRDELDVLHMTDFAWGPDGSLYVLNYSTRVTFRDSEPTGGSIIKINYNGPQYDPTLCDWIVQGCTDPSAGNYNPSANMDDGSCTGTPVQNLKNKSTIKLVTLTGSVRWQKLPEGTREVRLFNLSGERVFQVQVSSGSGQVRLPENLKGDGVYYAEYKLK